MALLSLKGFQAGKTPTMVKGRKEWDGEDGGEIKRRGEKGGRRIDMARDGR